MITPDSPNARRGDQLHPEDRRHALRAYVHRYTGEHKPQWAKQPRPDGTPYPVQFAADRDWLAHTWFAVKKDGRLDQRHRACYSRPTWPHNPELRQESV